MEKTGLITQSAAARIIGATPAAIAYRGKKGLGLTRIRRGRFIMYPRTEVLSLASAWKSMPHPNNAIDVVELLKVGA